jgi:hypothetical protein
MFTNLAELLPYKLLHKYPGMRPRDEVIWDKFIQKFPDQFIHCFYNVPVGNPAKNSEEREAMLYNGAYGVTQWRVDVVAVNGDKNWVIEIKPDADTHAIGEVLAYKELLIAEGRLEPGAIAMIVTNEASEILQQACFALDIVCIQV